MTETNRPNFALNGPSIELDTRTLAVRGDLADIALAGKLFVPHYAKPMEMRCTSATSVHQDAATESEAVAALAVDDRFMAVDIAGNWIWGFCADSHLVGYVPLDRLSQIK
jgi:hypothetical protein